MTNLEKIKKVLETTPGINDKNEVVDNRYYLLTKFIKEEKNKDNKFYQELIYSLGKYINESDKNDIEKTDIVLNIDGSINEKMSNKELSLDNRYYMYIARFNLANVLFKYICHLLEKNKNIQLNYEALVILLNRNPKELSLSAGNDFIYRSFDYSRLAKIIKDNNMLKDFSNYAIYQLLIDSFQINNNDVFKILVDKEDFEKDHKALDYFLSNCNARTFIDVTNIIKNNYEKDFNRINFIKKKNNNFPEIVIMEILNYSADEDGYDLIHQILTNKDITINYNENYSDYFGWSNLKSLIALYGNKTIINDLLQDENNIQDYYFKGNDDVALFTVYAKVGEYKKAIETLNRLYTEGFNIPEEFNDDIAKQGYCKTEPDYRNDSIVEFFQEICKSLNESNMISSAKNKIICEILKNKNLKYFNAEKILPIIKETLWSKNYDDIVEQLKEKHNRGEMFFITSEVLDGLIDEVILKIMTEEEFENFINNLNDNNKIKKLV